MKKYQIQGTIGAGYKEEANFNPRENKWEYGKMDIAKYDIETRSEAEDLLKLAKQDEDVSDVEIIEFNFENNQDQNEQRMEGN